MNRLISILLVTILSGCASQIMNSYVGKDVREVMLDYGPPNNAFDLAEGQRAFQWVKNNSYTMPATANTSGSINTYGSSTWVNSNTTITGGQTINSKCVYTLIAEWNKEVELWRIISFRKPSLMCE